MEFLTENTEVTEKCSKHKFYFPNTATLCALLSSVRNL